MGNSRQQSDRLPRRRTLVQHHADDQDANQPGPDWPVVDKVQPDAKTVLIHSIHAAGKPVRECETGMHALRLDGNQSRIISTRTVVVIAPVERIRHD